MNLIHTGILLAFLPFCAPQRKIQGDIKEQRISQVADIDERNEQIYRRPATYLILASKIVRPDSIYQVVATLYQEAIPMRIKASLAKNGVEVYGADEYLKPLESKPILLQVPPGNDLSASYRLKIEGYGQLGGAMVFQNETQLQFSARFLTIIISTNKVVYTAIHSVKIRVVLLRTDLLPYEDVADLFIIDPDGFVIRKWNSKHLNSGVMTQEFQVPDFPKVGFWTIRVVAQGQVEEKKIKIEKYYVPKFETFVRMPSFHFSSDTAIEVVVNHEYTFDKIGFGNVLLRWYAKPIDHSAPLYNDTVFYREEYEYYYKRQNFYTNSLYESKDGVVYKNISLIQYPDRYGYNGTTEGRPFIPKVHKWTFIKQNEYFQHRAQEPKMDKAFYIRMQDISNVMGKTEGIDVMAEAFVTDFFYNNTQRGWCITRIINKTLDLSFLGQSPQVFKPGMLFETQVSVKFSDQVPLDPKTLETSTLTIEARAQLEDGGTVDLQTIKIPPKASQICNFQDVDRLQHYNQAFGAEAENDVKGQYEINPASFFGDDPEENTDFCLQLLAKETQYKEYREKGIFQIKLKTPPTAQKIDLTAVYIDPETNQNIITKLEMFAAYAPKNEYIHVRSSNKKIEVGEYVVFHVTMSNLMTYFDWIILSKNMILNRGREYSDDFFTNSATFSIVVSAEMAPGFHILVYTKTSQDYLIADSSYYPVKSINRHNIEFSLTQLKDHTMKTVEGTCRGDPGSFFAVATPRQFLLGSQGSNLITYANVLDQLFTFEKSTHHIHRTFTTDREGEIPDQVAYYASQDYGIDPNRTLELQDLVVFTDFLEVPRTPKTRQCYEDKGFYPCMINGCFTKEMKCNGIKDCTDGYDEFNCGDKSKIDQELTMKYRFSRFNRYDDFYDNWDGDWGWFHTNIDEDREQFETIEVPETADDWFFMAFSVSKKFGLTVQEEIIPYSTTRPLWLYCEGPEVAKRGETIGIRCTVFNWINRDMEYVLILKGSEQYEFVHVEDHGTVVSFNPRTSKGDHHHFLHIRGESNMDVHFPIKPKIDLGIVSVTIELSSQLANLEQTVDIELIGEGSVVHKHTSAILDLKSRAKELEFFDIVVDENPIVPYEIFRRFISGSPKGSVIISGDVIGPTFRNDEPVSMESMFPTVHGRCGKGTEYHVFNLAANTWLLHYLRLTNQLNDKGLEFRRRIFEAMNVELTGVMRRYSSFGSFALFDRSGPSVWLTAWTISILQDVAFQDWEDYIYIDPEIFQNSVMWMINYQDREGYFTESEFAQVPILQHINEWGSTSNKTSKIALTAHVLIAMDKTAPALTGKVKTFGSRSRLRAKRYLEKKIDIIRDPYEMALVTYALVVTKSSDSDLAFDKLYSMKREERGMVYWSRSRIATNNVTYEFTRPFLNPKAYQIDDALAVETTGWALLTLFKKEGGGITFIQDQIVKWLNTMRLGVGGFISTVDTVVALEALVRYSYHNNIKDLTNMFVTVGLPDSNLEETYNIVSKGVSEAIEIPLKNVWGNVFLQASGAGQALAQLDITYGVDYPTFAERPPKECFNLKFKEIYSGRNKSEIAYNTCFKWSCTSDSEQSGFTMLIVDIPTGYILLQPDANKIVRSGVIPQLRDSDMEKPGKTIWYFDYIPSYEQCFSHTVRRYYPVANLSRTRQIMLIEPYRPERFIIKSFNATSLYILSVCEVCGSYQCPYCPFYSGAPSLFSGSILFITFSLTVFMLNP